MPEAAYQGYGLSLSSDTRALWKGGQGPDNYSARPALPDLQEQANEAYQLHQHDLREGFGETRLPYALARKVPECRQGMGLAVCFPVQTMFI